MVMYVYYCTDYVIEAVAIPVPILMPPELKRSTSVVQKADNNGFTILGLVTLRPTFIPVNYISKSPLFQREHVSSGTPVQIEPKIS
ncbi:hypothetical protein CANTEDRAFT_116376, partial [Yamadazyma tenuis ATCC 10573]